MRSDDCAAIKGIQDKLNKAGLTPCTDEKMIARINKQVAYLNRSITDASIHIETQQGGKLYIRVMKGTTEENIQEILTRLEKLTIKHDLHWFELFAETTVDEFIESVLKAELGQINGS